MFQGHTVAVIMPALNEAEVISEVIAQIDRKVADWVVVGDNGSTDDTATVAKEAGAIVVSEPRRGYGSACLKAIAAVPEADVLVFLDADGGDDPSELPLLLTALFTGDTEIVIGSRLNEKAERGSLTPVQKWGNTLTCTLVRLMWGVRFTDLGPFRTLRRITYDQLNMCDPDFGWTIEMQVKAAQAGVKVTEVPVAYRNRQAGHSKVSGTILGSWRAGKRILGYVFAAKAAEVLQRRSKQGTLIIFTRLPEAGQTKTRLIPALGAEGAATLHRALVKNTLAAAIQTGCDLEIHHTGSPVLMREWLGSQYVYRSQGEGDLGGRMAAALDSVSGPKVLIGTDCPDISEDILLSSFAVLKKNEVVLGAARDGGYYLIGMRGAHPDLFCDMPWGSDQVLAVTRERLAREGVSWGEVAVLHDIDRPADLNQVPPEFLIPQE